MTVKLTTLTKQDAVLFKPINALVIAQRRAAIRVAQPAKVARSRRVERPRVVSKPLWLAPMREAFSEKLLYSMLALSALSGIAYGFMSVIERAQNWAAFNAWVTRILGA